MKKITCSLILALCCIASSQDDPALRAYQKFVTLVGTKWVGTIEGPQGKVEVAAEFVWGPNQSAVKAISSIAVDPKKPMISESYYAYVKKDKKMVYMDIHGGPEVYAGDGWMEGDKVILEFQHTGHKEVEYKVAISFPKEDVMKTEFWSKQGTEWKPIMSYDRKKVKVGGAK
jgi:hypothetical protein